MPERDEESMTNPHLHENRKRSDPQPDVEQRILAIAADIFQADPAHIDLSMGPDDIDRWDSLNHLRLITEVEKAYDIRLTMQQIQQIQSLADVVTSVSGAAA